MSFVSLNIEYFPDPTRGVPVYEGYIYVGEPDTDPEVPGNQVSVTLRLSDGSTVAAIQPIRTGAGGVALHNGSPVQLLVPDNYSLKVLDRRQSEVYYVANTFGFVAGDPVLGVGLLLAGLKSLPAVSDGAVAITSGRINFTDQGGGTWVWDSSDLSSKVSSDPLSGVYAAPAASPSGANGAWVRQAYADVEVSWFGAVGDGATDDTAAIQAAIDFLSNTTRNGTVKFGSFDYLVTNTITLRLGVSLKGGDSWVRKYPESSPVRVPRILHSPVAAGTDLFIDVDHAVSYNNSWGVSGLIISSDTINSRHAFHLVNPGAAHIYGLDIAGFEVGIWFTKAVNFKVSDSLIGGQSVASVFASNSSTISTTVVFDRLYLRDAPWLIISESEALVDLTCNSCVFETALGAVDLHKSNGGLYAFNDCYTENIPSDGSARPIIQAGVNGTSIGLDLILQVVGGRFSGANGGFHTDSVFINADEVLTVNVEGAVVLNVNHLFETTAATQSLRCFNLTNLTATGGTTKINNLQKVIGELPYQASAGPLATPVFRTARAHIAGASGNYYELRAGFTYTDSDFFLAYNDSNIAAWNNLGFFGTLGVVQPKCELHSKGKAILGCPNNTPVTLVDNDSVTFYHNGAGDLKIRVKDSTGVIKTATIPLA